MSRASALMAGAVLASALVTTAAHADTDYCSHYGGPTDPPRSQDGQSGFAFIVTGYRGAGSAGALDSNGCLQGKQVLDTRLVYPHADFALVILSMKCVQGTRYPGTIALKGLGASVPNAPVVCGAPDAKGNTYYVSDPYKINPDATGTLTATVTQVVQETIAGSAKACRPRGRQRCRPTRPRVRERVVFSYVAETHTVV